MIILHYSQFIFLVTKRGPSIVHLLGSSMAISICICPQVKAKSKLGHFSKTNSMGYVQYQLIQDTPKAYSKMYPMTKTSVETLKLSSVFRSLYLIFCKSWKLWSIGNHFSFNSTLWFHDNQLKCARLSNQQLFLTAWCQITTSLIDLFLQYKFIQLLKHVATSSLVTISFIFFRVHISNISSHFYSNFQTAFKGNIICVI